MPFESSDILPGIYAGYVSLVLFVLVTAIFVGAETAAQGTLAAGALGSSGLGFYSVNRALATPLRGTLQYTRPWLWFTAFAAFGLYDGRYQPLVASAASSPSAWPRATCWAARSLGGGAAGERRTGRGHADRAGRVRSELPPSSPRPCWRR